jgi:hypothetical protein
MATPMSPHPTGLPAPNGLSALIRVPAPIRQAFLETGLECSEDIQADDRCTICFEGFTNINDAVKIRDCKHVFCRECLLRWLKLSNQCPMCRSQLSKRPRRRPRLWRGNTAEESVQVDLTIRWSLNDDSDYASDCDGGYQIVSPGDISSDPVDDNDDDDDYVFRIIADDRQLDTRSINTRQFFRLETITEREHRRFMVYYNRRRREIEAARQKELDTADTLRGLRTRVWEGLRRIVSRCWCVPYTLS